MNDTVTHADIDRLFHLLRTDPQKFMALANKLVEQHPTDRKAYFSRHWAWAHLDRSDLALADLDKSLALEDNFVTHRVKGRLLHSIGCYEEAIASLDRCERMEPERWTEALGPLSGRIAMPGLATRPPPWSIAKRCLTIIGHGAYSVFPPGINRRSGLSSAAGQRPLPINARADGLFSAKPATRFEAVGLTVVLKGQDAQHPDSMIR